MGIGQALRAAVWTVIADVLPDVGSLSVMNFARIILTSSRIHGSPQEEGPQFCRNVSHASLYVLEGRRDAEFACKC